MISSSVSVSSLPIHLAKWKAIRAFSSENYKQALQELNQVIKETSKQEIQVMRLSRVVLQSEHQLTLPLSSSSSSYSVRCVEKMIQGLKEHCGTDYVSQDGVKMSVTVRQIFQQMCLVEKSMENYDGIDWKEVCIE